VATADATEQSHAWPAQAPSHTATVAASASSAIVIVLVIMNPTPPM
jgi:hypothetical protein